MRRLPALFLAALLAPALSRAQTMGRPPGGPAGPFESAPLVLTEEARRGLEERLPIFEGEPLAALPSLQALSVDDPGSRLLLIAMAGEETAAAVQERARKAGLAEPQAVRMAALAEKWSKAASHPAVAEALRLRRAELAPSDSSPPAPASAEAPAPRPAPSSLDAAFDGRPRGEEFVPFRLHIRKPGVYLLERDVRTGDDSNGRLVAASLGGEDLSGALSKLRTEGGPSALTGRRLFVTGVERGSEREARERVQALASAAGLGLDKGSVRVLSVPRPWSKGRVRALVDRLVYFFPSFTRDFQRPLRGEIVSDVVTTSILEVPNAVYLLAALPQPDAGLVLGTHAALLSVYTLFQRSTVNWLLRAGKAELYAKQVLLSLPFVLNYNILGHFSALTGAHRTLGTEGLLALLPGALAGFAVTQGLTLLLQTAFYSIVVTGGFRAWAARQNTPENAGAARSWVAYLLLPWLWLDSIFLTEAGTTATVLFHAGPFMLTLGHLHLAAWTALGAWAASRTRALDASLEFFKRLRAALGRRLG